MSTKSTYKRLNQGAARIMFIMGLGLAAVILGSILSVGLSMRLAPRLQGLPLPVLQVLDLLLRNLWSLLILPLLVYAAARVAELRVWTTSIATLMTGSFFLLMLAYLQRGAGEVWRSAWDFISWALVMAVSVLWIRRAVLKGTEYREAQTQKAKAQAAAKVSEYDVFRQQAAALGERNAARELESAEATASASLAATGTDGGIVPAPPIEQAEVENSTTAAEAGGGNTSLEPDAAPEPPASDDASGKGPVDASAFTEGASSEKGPTEGH